MSTLSVFSWIKQVSLFYLETPSLLTMLVLFSASIVILTLLPSHSISLLRL
jgi:hypothetical protein